MLYRSYTFILTGALFAAALSGCGTAPAAVSSADAQKAIVAIERQHEAAVGVSLRDESGKVLLEWRSRERFPMASTVKALLCARVYEAGLQNKSAEIGSVAVVSHSPVYGKADPKTVVTLGEACHAALTQSDNRATNFIFSLTGGPKALTAWLRSKGDTTTRSDRIETDLNLSGPGEYRDTTTPSNASLNWQRLDKELPAAARTQWLSELAANRMADQLFRRTLPEGWTIHDRSGSGSDAYGTSRAVHAILVTDQGKRYYAALHLKAKADATPAQRDAILQQVIDIVYDRLIQARIN